MNVDDLEVKVLMTFVEADKVDKADRGPSKNLMALVEEISSKPKPISVPQKFIDDKYFSLENEPLTTVFEVDLEVVKKGGDIIRYRLIEIHGEVL